nr:Chain P, 9-meric peptide from Tegument protein pp65 [Human betaherpesvirus 5]
NLVPAVATV